MYTTLNILASASPLLGFVINIDTSAFLIVVSTIFALFVFSVVLIFHFIAHKARKIRASINLSYEDNLNLNSDTCKRLTEAIPSAIVIYDAAGNCTYINNHCRTMFGLAADQPVSNLFNTKILSPENQHTIKSGKNIRDVAFLNYTDDVSVILGKSTSSKQVIKYSIQTIHDIHGNIANYILAINDITDEYTQRQTAEEYSLLLRDSLQLSGISAYIYDVHEDRYYKFKGPTINPCNLNATDVFNHISPLHRSQYIEMFLKIKNGDIATDRRRYKMYSNEAGAYFYVETFTNGMTDVSGNVVRILQTIRNVTENQEKIIELEAIRLIQSKAMDIAHMVSWRYMIDKQTFKNAAPGINISKSFKDAVACIHPEDRNKYKNLFDKLSSGDIDAMHITVRKISPDSVFELYAVPMRTETGEISEIIGISCDVSDHYTTESNLYGVRNKVHAIIKASKIWVYDYNCTTDKLYILSWKYDGARETSKETFLRLVHPSQKADVNKILDKVRRQEIDCFNMQMKVLSDNGEEYSDIEFNGQAYEYLNGLPTKVIAYAKYI